MLKSGAIPTILYRSALTHAAWAILARINKLLACANNFRALEFTSKLTILAVAGRADDAAEITYAPRGDSFIDISIHGAIAENDDQRFHEIEKAVSAFDSKKTITAKLDSPGGMLFPGLGIGESIHQHGWTTLVPENTVCGSVCASIWIAGGAHRRATDTSLIGFHAASDSQRRENGAANAVLGAYYTAMGLSYKAIAYLTTASPTEVIYLTEESAKKYGIAYEGALPTEGDIQLLLQRLFPPPSPQSQSSPQPSGIVTTDNLMLRRDPDPSSPSILEGLYPDYIPAGQHFSVKHSSHACRKIYSGKIWCELTYNASDRQTHKGWVNAYYLALSDGTPLACELDGSNSQIPECHIYLRAH
jgi:hypothetical protein